MLGLVWFLYLKSVENGDHLNQFTMYFFPIGHGKKEPSQIRMVDPKRTRHVPRTKVLKGIYHAK